MQVDYSDISNYPLLATTSQQVQTSCFSIPLSHRHSTLCLPSAPFLFCTNTPSLLCPASSIFLIDTSSPLSFPSPILYKFTEEQLQQGQEHGAHPSAEFTAKITRGVLHLRGACGNSNRHGVADLYKPPDQVVVCRWAKRLFSSPSNPCASWCHVFSPLMPILKHELQISSRMTG